jgi:hypothetical protein
MHARAMRIALVVLLGVLAAGATVGFLMTSKSSSSARAHTRFASKLSQEELAGNRGEPGDSDAANGEDPATAAEEAYAERAYPASDVPLSATLNAKKTWTKLQAHAPPISLGAWTLAGPTSQANVPDILSFSGGPYTTSGRITALAIDPSCSQSSCRLWVGAAGGGIWRTDNALAATPSWTFLSDSFGTNAVGTLTYVNGVLYAGTGEPNASGDSEAGVGIYKSTDGGNNWTQLNGSPSFYGRSISSIVVVPGTNGQTMYVSSTRGVRGVASVTGGAVSLNPGFPGYGLWKSTDGGASFTQLNPQTVVLNSAPGGTVQSSFGSIRGVNHVELDPTDSNTVYAAAFGDGIYKSTNGGTNWTEIFKAAAAPANTARDEFAVTALPTGATRMYVGDGGSGPSTTGFYRTDDVASATPKHGWKLLTSDNRSNPYYATFNYCTGQCWYDNLVVTSPTNPDVVYLGGSYQYSEYGFRSNGRGVLYSTDAGEDFTDMTWDAQTSPTPAGTCCDPSIYAQNGIHPDQHALVFAPSNTGLFFEGSDGGLVRSSGTFTDASSQCTTRPLSTLSNLACQHLLSRIPTTLTFLNTGLSTLQFQSLSVAPDNANHLQGGTQDNGTFDGTAGASMWPQEIYGDGGQSGFDVSNSAHRFNTFFANYTDANFQNGDASKWVVISGPLFAESSLFYKPIIADPVVSGTIFVGEESVWRTQDWGGDQSFLEANCPEFTTPGDQASCGDFVKLGSSTLTASALGSRSGGNVSAVERAASDTGTLWAATTTGRVFVSKNADAAAGSVTFTRIDAADTPGRFVSSIAVDPSNANRAWISYSGYDAVTPSTPGHVFSVKFNPNTGAASWTDISNGIGDLPVTSVVADANTGDLYASTDFGVLVRPHNANVWSAAGTGLPKVEVAGLTIASGARKLYAATHGRSAWQLTLP